MNRSVAVVLFAVAALALSYLGHRTLSTPRRDMPAKRDVTATPSRIVSLAPSITEVLFSLEIGDAVVGVTNRCNYPPEARTKQEVGGYYDLNYEAVAALDPDLIVTLPAHRDARQHFSAQGYETLVVNQSTIEGIIESIQTLGHAAGAAGKAEELVDRIRGRIESIGLKVRDPKRPRVMIAVGRDVGSGKVEDVCIAGKDGFYDQIIALAGGVNVYDGHLLFPMVSAEGIVTMNPDVIIDMTGDMSEHNLDPDSITSQWAAFPQVQAVMHERVHVFDQNYMVIPGPRFVLILEELARVLHPELDGS